MTEPATENRSSPPLTEENESNAVASLLRSCASIRKRTRSCLTISHHQHDSRKKGTHPFSSIESSEEFARRIREEEQTGVELERKILDYRAAIGRLKKRQQRTTEETQPSTANSTDTVASSKAATRAATQQHRNARSKLMDETLRQQQEELLLERLAMSQPAIAAAYHSSATTENDNANMAMKTLIQEANRCRMKQTKIILETQRDIDNVKRQMMLEAEKGLQLQKDNQVLWKDLHQLKAQTQNQAVCIHKKATTSSLSEEQRLATETLVLKRALLDIISGSDLDWYNDERLRETLLRLEK